MIDDVEITGAYLVEGWNQAGDFDEIAVTVGAGETVNAVFVPK